MLKEILAYFECDRCGIEFIIGVDPAKKAFTGDKGEGDSAFDLAVDSIRGGLGYRQKGKRWIFKVSGSVSKAGKHLCADCTSIIDQRIRQGKDVEDMYK